MRRSGEQNSKGPWSPNEICVCTPAMLLNAIKLNEVDMSQQSLLIMDEVHEATSPLSSYGLLLPYIIKCPASQRPRVLGLSASPSSSNVVDIRQSISSLCDRIFAVPYTPLIDDSNETAKSINCEYVGIYKSTFELKYETFVIDSLEKLSRHHSFFDSNWTTIPFNVPTRIKIDMVVKSLSHSKFIAQSMADMALYELTQWMRKWIDSLDLMQIFGPRKLIEFIQADMKFVEQNGSLQRISPQLVPLAAHMQSSIERLVAESSIADNSPKLEELIRRLKAHRNDQERILIFVDRRTTAERLCRKLKNEPDIVASMNPLYIVGNAGTNFPKELQQSILEMFSKGECRVLISTSVLEQGIDVTACGLVICFDGLKSVKSTIQSRGRARKDVANFVAFVASEEQRKANELTQMEVSMDYAIRQLMVEYNSIFDPYVNQEIEKFLSDSDRLTVNESTDYADEEYDENELLLNVHVDPNMIHFRFFNFVNSQPLVELLVDHIESCFSSPIDSVVKIGARLIHAQFAVTDIENESKIISEISSFATNRKYSHVRSWFDVSYNIAKCNEENVGFIDGLDFDELKGFYFKDFLTVIYDSKHIWREKFTFAIRNNEMVLSTAAHHFSIRSIDVDGPVLINDTNACFEIFLCLRIPPCYFTDKELDHYDFNNYSFNLSLKRNRSIDSKTSWYIRNAFQNLNIQVNNVCNLRKLETISRCDDDVYAEEFLRNYLIQTWHSTHAAVLPTILPASIRTQLHTCGSVTNLMLLLNNTTPIRFNKLHIDHIADVALPFSACDSHSDDYVLCGRVKVTPNRHIFTGLEPVPKNRVFRYFPNPNNFLMVSFCDEYGGNPWRSQHVCEWFLSVLQYGIRVGSTYFTFLGCSNSQLREGRCWFSSLDRTVVYNKIGKFPDTWSAGRKLTRIACK